MKESSKKVTGKEACTALFDAPVERMSAKQARAILNARKDVKKQMDETYATISKCVNLGIDKINVGALFPEVHRALCNDGYSVAYMMDGDEDVRNTITVPY